MMHDKTPKIVVVGGGAAGLELATALGKKLGKKHRAQITLIDKSLTHLWKPLLHEVAAGTIDSNEDELNYISHAYANYFQFQLGDLVGLNRQERIVEVVYPSSDEKISIKYDYLIIAIGSVSNDYDIPGVSEHCYFLDTREQADQFQHEFIQKLLRENNFNIAIIGGGATGVELAAELRYAINKAIKFGIKHGEEKRDINITIIDSAQRILSALPRHFTETVEQELKQRNIKIISAEHVSSIDLDTITTSSGKVIPADLKVWAAGIKAPTVLSHLDGLETNLANQLVVKPNLQTTIDDNIFVIGDCAACYLESTKTLVPARAQAAHQQASTIVKSLKRLLKNQVPLNYKYVDHGSLVSLSKYAAVGQFMGTKLRVKMEGKLAHLVYLSLYKSHQVKLYGCWHVILITIAKLLSRRVKPQLKLH